MKTILKSLVGLIVGGVIGLILGGLIAVLFTDLTLGEYLHKFGSIDLSEGLGVFLVGVGAFIVSLLLLVPIHELGHLIAGLLTGYKFVSFRIFNFTIIKEDGKFRVKRFAVSGTGGQCLLTPPDLPLEEIPMGWYNFGGLLANILVLALVLPLFMLDLNPYVAEALMIFVLTDVVMLVLNGIPVQVGGVGNDAYNLRLLRKSIRSKRGIVNQLRANALIQEGVRPKDMPEHLFKYPEDVDYKNALELAVPLMYASRLIDETEYEKALDSYEDLYAHKDEIMPLYLKEISCELAFLYLRTGHIEKAEKMLDAELKKYVRAYSKMMSSKERLLCAMALYLEKDRGKAQEILSRLITRKNDYLLAGEVSSDIALIQDMLEVREEDYIS